jgi:hypothetical protein
MVDTVHHPEKASVESRYLVKEECSGGLLNHRLGEILKDIELAREIRVLRLLLEARLAAQRAHGPVESDGLPLLPPAATWRLDDVERGYSALVLRAGGGNLHEAARRLDVAYSSLRSDLVRWRLIASGREAPPDAGRAEEPG